MDPSQIAAVSSGVSAAIQSVSSAAGGPSTGLRPSLGGLLREGDGAAKLRIQRCGIGSSCGCPPRDKLAGIEHDLRRATAAGGTPLLAASGERMDSVSSFDFAAVRVHSGAPANDAAAALGARALTAGTDIVFRAGEYQPGTRDGDRLLAHELAHVVQQAHGGPQGVLDTGANDQLEKDAGLAADHASPAAEREARGAAMIAAMGQPVPALTGQPPTIARQDDDDLGTQPDASIPDSSPDAGPLVEVGSGSPDAGPGPPDAGTADAGAPSFTENVNVNKTSVPVDVRANAAEFNNNIHARFGSQGDHTEIGPASYTYTPDAAKNVIAATVTWVVTEQFPSVHPSPGSTIAQTELDACKALASAVERHEDKHAAIEQTLRKGFANSLRGVHGDDPAITAKIDAKVHALDCKVGAAQRDLDNKEGKITLDANNNLQVSGVDHPEYVDGCP